MGGDKKYQTRYITIADNCINLSCTISHQPCCNTFTQARTFSAPAAAQPWSVDVGPKASTACMRPLRQPPWHWKYEMKKHRGMINESRVSCHTLKMQMGKLLTVSLILEVAVSLVSYWQQQFTKLDLNILNHGTWSRFDALTVWPNSRSPTDNKASPEW